jgi:DNA-directed RNA polymerase
VIETKLSGSTIYPRLYFQGDEIQCEPSKNKLPPNYIHSLDATALMMTVNACVKQGVCDFGMVHDSYATLAADASSMAAILRTQFYMLYSKPVLATFHSQMEEQYTGEQPLPRYPEAGEYDLRQVLQARYFFH